MSIINPTLSNSVQSWPQLAQSLASLSSGAQPSALPADVDDTADAPSDSDSTSSSETIQQVAIQNAYAALADSGSAATANLSAADFLSTQPAAALAAQGNVPGNTVLGLLEAN